MSVTMQEMEALTPFIHLGKGAEHGIAHTQ